MSIAAGRRLLIVSVTAIVVCLFVSNQFYQKRSTQTGIKDGHASQESQRKESRVERINDKLDQIPMKGDAAGADSAFHNQLANGALSSDDPRVIRFIREHISKPSGRPLNLADKTKGKTDFSIAGTSAFVDRLLGGKTGGFFVECGGADGETVSNSLFFELSRSWTGILIELNPNFFSQILAKHRNVYALHACMSTKRSPSVMKVKPAGLSGGIAEEMSDVQLNVGFVHQTRNIDVLCFPLNAIMDAMDIHDVDFMSLDVEGAEMAVLQTIDFTRLNINVLVVEYVVQGIDKQPEKGMQLKMERLQEIRRIMAATGLYKDVGVLPTGTSDKDGHDVVFQRI